RDGKLRDRVAVRLRQRCHLRGSERAAGARAVLDDERAAEMLFSRRRERAQRDIGGSARGPGNDEGHRLGRKGLRGPDAEHGRQRGGAGGQLQKSAARKCHDVPSRYSGFAPENLTTLPHFSVSSAMYLVNCAAEPGSSVAPMSANRFFTAGSARIALTVALS